MTPCLRKTKTPKHNNSGNVKPIATHETPSTPLLPPPSTTTTEEEEERDGTIYKGLSGQDNHKSKEFVNVSEEHLGAAYLTAFLVSCFNGTNTKIYRVKAHTFLKI